MTFIKNIGLLLLALVFQQTLVRLIGMGGIRPDLVLIALVAISLRHGCIQGLYCGLFIGLVQDVYAIETLGANALSKCLVGYLFGLLDERMVKIMPATKVLLLGAAFIFHDVIFFWAAGLPGRAYLDAMWRLSLPGLIYTLLVAALLYSLSPIRPRRQSH